ncbi:lipopolysaccharide-induced tumor necrosis factor-alpha factor homolog [Sitophilus oryzae]|uniref:Lipopolysaccharide-induced tumor necrosis factor-alpha factor homolog n=1 Tax=Sitophilus oryzae TaxID=7048 RepID=A0A6J2YTN9_SITOR|nr:lipopolysaccharide-induced tumor necrosis factor-alpha factor homolog [Sitophilus oryzae]
MQKDAPPPYSPNAPGFVPNQQPGMYPPGAYPPPPHAGPPPVTVGHTVIVTTAPRPLGPNPAHTTCPYCHADIITSVETEASTKTHLFALLLCLFVCWPCVCLPYCMDSCLDKKHYCPNCKAYLGTYAE